MTAANPRLSSDECARLGEAIFRRDVQPTLRPQDDGKFVAIDVESGRFEIDGDDFTATERLLGKQPHAQIWIVRAGQVAAYRLGKMSHGDVR